MNKESVLEELFALRDQVAGVRDTAVASVVLGDEGLDITRLHLRSRPAVSRLADILS
jgi:hypothetical protein